MDENRRWMNAARLCWSLLKKSGAAMGKERNPSPGRRGFARDFCSSVYTEFDDVGKMCRDLVMMRLWQKEKLEKKRKMVS